MSLAETTAHTLRAYLEGRGLPILGGGTEPAEIILRAIVQASNPQELAASLAPVLAQVVDESTAELQDGLTPALRFLLHQTFELATDLPSDKELAFSLPRLACGLEAKIPEFWLQDPLAPLAVRALAYQQTDGQVERERLWFHLLELGCQSPSWTPQQRTIILSAWRGLLYIPSNRQDERTSRVVEVNIPRIESGLLTLTTGVQSREGGSRLVLQALGVLAKAFPRSPQFWSEKLGSRIKDWPPLLREAVDQQWPGLAQLTTAAASSSAKTNTLREGSQSTPHSRRSFRRSFESPRDRFRQSDILDPLVASPVPPLPKDLRP